MVNRKKDKNEENNKNIGGKVQFKNIKIKMR